MVSEIDGAKRVPADTVVLPIDARSVALTGSELTAEVPDRLPSYSCSIAGSDEGNPKCLDVEILWHGYAGDMTEPFDDFYAVIPAGGIGSRLWPLSRADAPKFLHDLTGSGNSLLRDTWDRQSR